MTVQQKEFYLPFVKKEQLAKDTYSFYFDSAKQRFNFLSGQYIVMRLDIKNPDSRGREKPFTISSSPLEKDYLVITTKVIKNPTPDGRGPSSFKKRLMILKPQELVRFFGPLGGFVLKDSNRQNKVFLAGGIGITPFYSMITYAHAKQLTIPITLIVSFSGVEDIVFYKELLDIAKKNPSIRIIYTVSHLEKSGVKWNSETGRISENLIRKYVRNIFKPLYYIVGPPKMVEAMDNTVRNMGIPNEKIFIENFTGC